MADLVGNLLVAQSGGPTAVINASVAGVIQQAGKYDQIEQIYGARYGILGILEENLIDLNEEKARTVEELKHTPAAALGTCRYKLDFRKHPERAAADMDRLFQVLQAHDIRYFFYIGGNDSQDTAYKVHQSARERQYDLRVIGIPKTIDNDLPHTDHCPGYGSVIKYAAATVMEIAADVGSMVTELGSCCLIEVMGRAAGWIAAGTALAKRAPADAPHLVLVPEILFDEQAFLTKVKQTVDQYHSCVVVVGEGLKNAEGDELAADRSRLDAFGHPVLSGAAEHLADLVQAKLKIKSRSVKLGYAQRAAGHYASATDAAEAAACGEAAVRAAIEGSSGMMVKLVRVSNEPYQFKTELQTLDAIANVEKLVPRDWMSEDGFLPNEKFLAYARPLIQGSVTVPMLDGLPRYGTLQMHPVDKKLPARNAT
jgi:6-phosphofructokinase 1